MIWSFVYHQIFFQVRRWKQEIVAWKGWAYLNIRDPFIAPDVSHNELWKQYIPSSFAGMCEKQYMTLIINK